MLYFDIYKIFWSCLLHRPSDPLLRNQKELRLTYKKIFLFSEQGMRRIMQQMTQKDFVISKYKIIGVVLSEWRECIFFRIRLLSSGGHPISKTAKINLGISILALHSLITHTKNLISIICAHILMQPASDVKIVNRLHSSPQHPI